MANTLELLSAMICIYSETRMTSILTQLYAEAITEYYIWEFHKEVGGARTCDLWIQNWSYQFS